MYNVVKNAFFNGCDSQYVHMLYALIYAIGVKMDCKTYHQKAHVNVCAKIQTSKRCLNRGSALQVQHVLGSSCTCYI